MSRVLRSRFLILIAPIVASVVIFNFLTVFHIRSDSMMPTLFDHDFVLVAKFGTPKRGDIVIVQSARYDPAADRNYLVKRVIAVAGDRLQWHGDHIAINGMTLVGTPLIIKGHSQEDRCLAKYDMAPASAMETISVPFTIPFHTSHRQHEYRLEPVWSDLGDPHSGRSGLHLVQWRRDLSQFKSDGELIVPPDSIFLMGDNRTSSIDSRTFGPVLVSDVVGRVQRVVFSINSGAERCKSPWGGTSNQWRWYRFGRTLH